MGIWSTQSLTKRFGSFTALEDLTVDIGPGITGVVGHNGAGKSTLIRILLGLEPASSGSATLLGQPVGGSVEARARVGFMPEYDCLPPDVTAAAGIMHYARLSGLPQRVARERTSDVLRHVGLAEERHRAMGTYSTGMKQRAKLAQALVHDPELVMLDEPTNGLDPAGRDEMLALIDRVGHEFGISVLVTSHLLGELERVCDHVVVLDAGRLVTSSPLGELTGHTGALEVEVLGEPDAPDALVAALAAAGLEAHRAHELVVVTPGDQRARDHVVMAASDLGLGLVRMAPSRHSLTELFVTAGGEGA